MEPVCCTTENNSLHFDFCVQKLQTSRRIFLVSKPIHLHLYLFICLTPFSKVISKWGRMRFMCLASSDMPICLAAEQKQIKNREWHCAIRSAFKIPWNTSHALVLKQVNHRLELVCCYTVDWLYTYCFHITIWSRSSGFLGVMNITWIRYSSVSQGTKPPHHWDVWCWPCRTWRNCMVTAR